MKNVAVIGAGTMGNGIAHVFSLYGHSIILCDVNKEILDIAIDTIQGNMKRQCSKGTIDEKKMNQSYNRISLTCHLEDLKECNLVIEAVKEDF